jgi:hypothetical protein
MKKNQMMKFAMVMTLALATTAAFAQKTVTLQSGTTNVALSSAFLDALQSLNIAPGVVYPTILSGTKTVTANFPIGSGGIDLVTALGNIDHQGGLTLSSSTTVVALQDFIIDTTGKSPVITGLAVVNSGLVGRITLFDLVLNAKPPLTLQAGLALYLPDVVATLDAQAASTLNSVFGTTGFKAGLSIGTAKVIGLTGGVQ